MKPRITHCRSCGARIIWCRTRAGKRIPVDAKPDPMGNLHLVGHEHMAPAAVPVDLISVVEYPNQDRYVSHFATCPEAKDWRR